MESTKIPPPTQTPPPEIQAPWWKKRAVQIMLGLIALGAAAWYIYDGQTHETTDDAYVSGHLHAISARVPGVVQQVLVDDNQVVQAGDVLVKLDPADYQASLDEAKANLDKAKLDFERMQGLEGTKAISQEDLDHSHTDYDTMAARMETARLQVEYTTIVAPASGRIGRKSVEVGNRVQAGQTLLMVVEKDVWVIANFKETQLARMHVHQPVTMEIDALPGKSFKGTIDSLAPASGNEFALLPADNSTGNFTKIVQRVPVKIRFDAESIRGVEERIRPGLSVVVKVDVAATPSN